MAFFVSVIYITVSYRLAVDLGLKTELNALHQQTMILMSEIEQDSQLSSQQLERFVNIVYLHHHVSVPTLYVHVEGKKLTWTKRHGISESDAQHLFNAIQQQLNSKDAFDHSMPNGVETFSGSKFLWQFGHTGQYKTLVIIQSQSLDDTLSYIIKRLFITSLFVFWLAIWLALSISSWINRKISKKNDALRKLATYDSLTNLPNRLYLNQVMSRFMRHQTNSARSTKNQEKQIKEGCLFVIDLDNFKEVNDTFGHAAGDELLQSVAKKLSASLTEQQILFRISGDEFIVWSPNTPIETAKNIAKMLIVACNEPVMINHLYINTGASIGFAHYPSHAKDFETLLLCADSAMYDAKQGRKGWSIFSKHTNSQGAKRLELRADLEDAFSAQRIKLDYQPKVSLNDYKITGVEGLARWHHPLHGVLYPYHFIELIEQSGRIQEFGRYIIKQAIEQLAIWQKQGIELPIAINISPFSLLDPKLLDFTLSLLKQHAIPSHMLEIELVESSISINLEYIFKRLDEFKQAGIKLAIDDFGTGMSSLSYISHLNVNFIKIDKSFMQGVEQDTKKRAVISAAIQLARNFNSSVIAEGIETQQQVDIVKKMGCEYGQGYYFAKPMSAQRIALLIKADQALPLSTEP
ncbi:EAL domain-containing protein [Marinomonas sp. THO17]|uniref:putative bifunctional diguanylate cyclase/phosphodiesterase n=1 Tax=Marinomonas sp. THO17 TaxID=3149048 RepID=UPI00336C0158